ncbi:hypothetical protein SGLAM104S_08171 [Streptomyces glaucescens]
MLDESLLDTPEALAEADHRGLLRGAAEAGAASAPPPGTPPRRASAT